MSVVSRIVDVLRLDGLSSLDGIYVTFRLRVTDLRSRLMEARPSRSWFSTPDEQQYRYRRVEKRAISESMVRLPVAR